MSVYNKIKLLFNAFVGVEATAGRTYLAKPLAAVAEHLTMARALDTATRVNSSGNIETVVANKTRLDYSLGIAKCPNLLVENTFVNALKRSINFELANDPWNKNNVVTTPNVVGVIDPKGLQEATFFAASIGSAEHNLNANSAVALTIGQTITYSAWVKAATSNIVQLVVGGFSFTPSAPYVNFGLIGDGIIYAGTYGSATIEKKPNGWYKCSITATAAANGTPNVQIGPILTTNAVRVPVFVGDGVTGVYVHNTQIIIGAIPLSDVFTSGAAVTKNADVISKTGLSGVIPQTKGAIFFDGYLQAGSLSDGVIYGLWVLKSDANNYIFSYRLNNNIRLEVAVGGVSQVYMGSALISPIKNKREKVIVTFELNNYNIYINGLLVNTDIVASVPPMSILSIGSDVAQYSYNGLIKAVAVTDELTLAEIEQLSSYPNFENMANQMQYDYFVA